MTNTKKKTSAMPTWMTGEVVFAHPEEVWAALEGPVHLLALVLRDDYYHDPVACRLAAATLIDLAVSAWPYASPLLPDWAAAWASTHGQRPDLSGPSEPTEDEPRLDPDVEDVISRIVHVVGTVNWWVMEEPDARRYVHSGLFLAVNAAAIATLDCAVSLIPADVAHHAWSL